MKDFTDSEPDEEMPLEKPKKPIKEKKPRSQAQIDALNKGRAKALAVREANKKVRKQEFDEKVVKAVEDKVEKIAKSKPVKAEAPEPRTTEKIIEKHYYHNVEGHKPEPVEPIAVPKKRVVKKKVQIEEDDDDDDEVLVKKPKAKLTPKSKAVAPPKPRMEIQFV